MIKIASTTIFTVVAFVIVIITFAGAIEAISGLISLTTDGATESATKSVLGGTCAFAVGASLGILLWISLTDE